MRLGAIRVVQEAERDPAGVERGFDALAFAVGARLGDDAIGKVRRAAVEERAREIAPLLPPDVAVAGKIEVGPRFEQEPRRLDRLAGAQELVRAGEDIERIAEEFRRDRLEQLRRVLLAVEDGDHRVGEILVAGAEKLRLRGGVADRSRSTRRRKR